MDKIKTDNKFKRFLTHLWRIVCYILLYKVALYFVVVVVMVYEAVSGATIDWDDKTSVDHLLVLLAPAVITFALMWWRLGREWKRDGFWRFDKLSTTSITTSAGIGLSMSLALNALFGTILSIASMGEPERNLMNSTYGSSFLALITSCLAIPVIEEVIYRGTVLNRLLEARVILPVALIIQGALFGMAHDDGLQIAYAFVTGIADGLVYLRTGSIWASIIAHIAFNALSVIFVPIYNYSDWVPSIVWFLCFVGSVVMFIVLMRVQKRRLAIPPVAAEAPTEWQGISGLTVTESLCPGCGEVTESGGQFCETCGKEL